MVSIRTAVLGLIAGSALALDAAAIDLLESYQSAVEADADYRAAEAVAEAGRQGVPLARSQLLPNISMNYTHFENELNARSTVPASLFGPARTLVQNLSYPSDSWALILRQPLYRPAQFAAWRQSKAQLQGVEAELARAQQDLGVRVSEAYFNALLMDERLKLVEAQTKAIELQVKAADALFRAGQGTRTDIDDAQARLDLKRAEILSAEQEVAQARHELEILINAPIESLAAIDTSRLQLTSPAPNSLGGWTAKVEAGSPELTSLEAQRRAAELEIKRAWAGHKPTADIIMQRSISSSDNVVNPGARYINNQLGVQVAVPLFAGGYVNAQVMQATARLSEVESRAEAARRKLATAVRREFQAVHDGIRRVGALELAERSAAQALLSNEKGFEAGTRTRVDILDAEQKLSEARLNLAQERLIYAISHLRLRALGGDLGVEAVSQVNDWLEAPTMADAKRSPTKAGPATPLKLAEVKQDPLRKILQVTKFEPVPPSKAEPAVAAKALAKPGQVLLKIEARGATWVEISDADGQVVFKGSLKSGEAREVLGRPPFSLTNGFAPALNTSVAGRPVPLNATAEKSAAAALPVAGPT